ncbi:MAG: porin family protein [Balneolaceae bacterium]
MLRKILTITSVLLLLSSPALSQQVWANGEGTSMGIRVGFDMQNITGNDEDGSDANNSLIPAFNVGMTVELPLAPNFYLKPGLLYTTKGAEREQPIIGGTETSTMTIRTSYIELPINLLYKPILGNGNLIVGFGPYVAMGVDGEAEVESGGTTENRDIIFQSAVDASDPSEDVVYFRLWDAGANFIVGYEFANRISLQLNAQLGLTDINPEREDLPNDESSLKNTGFGVSLGYRF